MIINNPLLQVLDESDKYLIGHIYEDSYLIEKKNGEEVVYDVFHGDPCCGLIGENNDWAIIAGDHLTVWRKGEIEKIKDEKLRNVYALRSNNNDIVEILIDPWDDNSAIWVLDVFTHKLSKVRDLYDYKGKEYTDEVIW